MARTKIFAGIDYFRLIAAFMVIAIHISPFEILNKNFDYIITYCIGRMAVPFFLMTTGYFVLAPYISSNFQRKFPFQKAVLKNGVLYLVTTIFYLPLSIYSGNIPHTPIEFIKWFIFDGTFYHLWYFPAVILGCILIVNLSKKSLSLTICFSVCTYIIGLLGDSYYGAVKGIPLLNTLYNCIFQISSYTRNGIFFTPIFLTLGMLLPLLKFYYPKNVCKKGFVISLTLMLIEGFVTYHMGIQRHNSMYLFLVPTMYFLFQLLLMISGKAPMWFRDASMLIYIIHPAVIIILRGIAKLTKLSNLLVDNTLIQYFLVTVLSLFFAFGIEILIKRRNQKCTRKGERG